jgi:hypothetical protein
MEVSGANAAYKDYPTVHMPAADFASFESERGQAGAPGSVLTQTQERFVRR